MVYQALHRLVAVEPFEASDLCVAGVALGRAAGQLARGLLVVLFVVLLAALVVAARHKNGLPVPVCIALVAVCFTVLLYLA